MSKRAPNPLKRGDHVKPDVKTLCNELVSVSDWRKLGLNLGVQDYELDKIERSHPSEDCGRWMQETFSLWLRHTPNASWGDVVGALRRMGENTVAERIEQKYIVASLHASPLTPPSSAKEFANAGTSSTTRRSSSFIKSPLISSTEAIEERNVQVIKSKFSNLVTKSCETLQSREIDVEEVETFLIIMYSSPNSRDGNNMVITVVGSARSLKEIFRALSIYGFWDYINYYLLQSIIEKFACDDDELNNMMEQYQKDLTGYALTLQIKTYLDATHCLHPISTTGDSDTPADMIIPPQQKHELFEELSVKIDANVTDHTLSYVIDLWQSLEKQFRLPQPVMILHNIAKGCISITWLIPANLVEYITKMAQETSSVFAEKHILRVMLKEQCIYPMETEPPQLVQETSSVFAKKHNLSAAVIRLECGDYVFEVLKPSALSKDAAVIRLVCGDQILFEKPEASLPETELPLLETEPPLLETKPPLLDTGLPLPETESPPPETEPPLLETEPLLLETKPPLLETKPPLLETEPPLLETKPPLLETKLPLLETEPPLLETKPPQLETKPLLLETGLPLPETKSPLLETKPPPLETKPPLLETKPPLLKTEPPLLETEPLLLETKPPLLETKPPLLETEPPLLETKPPQLETKPPLLETKPPLLETEPPLLETKPPLLETKLPLLETEPPLLETKPPLLETEPPLLETEPPLLETEPPLLETKPPLLETEPPLLETKPPQLETKPPLLETEPPLLETKPPLLETKLPLLETEPPLLETKPPQLETKPLLLETGLPLPETKSPLLETKPPPLETKPPLLETKPPLLKTEPPQLKTEPFLPETKPPLLEAEPPLKVMIKKQHIYPMEAEPLLPKPEKAALKKMNESSDSEEGGADHSSRYATPQNEDIPPIVPAYKHGYECKIIDPPAWVDALQTTCPICLQVLRNPHQTYCGHIFCKVCIGQFQALQKQTCPECKRTNVSTFPHESLRRMLNDLQVQCTIHNEEEACDWTGELRELDNHLNLSPTAPDQLLTGCKFVTLQCEFSYAGCKAQIPRKDMAIHMKVAQSYHNQLLAEKVKKQAREIEELTVKLRMKEEEIACTIQQMQEEFTLKLQSKDEAIAQLMQQKQDIKSTPHVHPVNFCFTVDKFKYQMENEVEWVSKPFYTHPQGYKMCVEVFINGLDSNKYVSLYTCIMKGENDNQLSWPFYGKLTVQLLNQKSDDHHHVYTIHYDKSIPQHYCERVLIGERNRGWGNHRFISHSKISRDDSIVQYVKDDCIKFRISYVLLYS